MTLDFRRRDFYELCLDVGKMVLTQKLCLVTFLTSGLDLKTEN